MRIYNKARETHGLCCPAPAGWGLLLFQDGVVTSPGHLVLVILDRNRFHFFVDLEHCRRGHQELVLRSPALSTRHEDHLHTWDFVHGTNLTNEESAGGGVVRLYLVLLLFHGGDGRIGLLLAGGAMVAVSHHEKHCGEIYNQ